MGNRGLRVAVGLLVLLAAVAVAGLAGCGDGSVTGTATATSTARAASVAGIAPAALKKALLTHVNGVAAATPASSGRYASVSRASASELVAGGVQVTPRDCAGSATEGFNPAALAGAPAAAVTFRVAGNGISEVLIASAATSASAALAGHVPAECARFTEQVAGKTFSYTVKEQGVTGVGRQARELHVQAVGVPANNQWSLIFTGTGFVGTVTVVGPNASDKAVRELGQQAYAFAAATLR